VEHLLIARDAIAWQTSSHSPRAFPTHKLISDQPCTAEVHTPPLTQGIFSRLRVKVNGLALNGYFLEFNWMVLKLSSN
jgi:hypothetical protein